MKENGRLWVTKTMVILFLLVLFVQLVRGEASLWSSLRGAMLLGVLCCGYHFGVSGGAVAGATAGLVEVLAKHGAESLGVLCIVGILAGGFRRLKKGGVLVACTCGVTCLGLWYAKPYVVDSLWEMLMAAVLFLWMPVESFFSVQQIPKIPGGKEELQRQKLEQVAESYGRLARSMETFQGETQWEEEPGREEGEEPLVWEEDWKGRFFESRQAVSMQFREMERALKEMAAQLDQAVDVTSLVEGQIRSGLRRNRLQVQRLLVLEREDRRQEAFVTVCTQGAGCVTAREVGESVGRILSKSLRPADGGRTVVGKEPCTIRLVEETKFRLLFGLARTAKASEDLSGDNFSCHELPDGQTMLCLSDGMGSGRQAFLESQLVTEWLEELLDAGFVPERAIHMVNGLLLVQKEQSPTTMDLVLVDRYSGQAFFYKQGAVGTFIRRGNQVLQVEPGALPMGVACGAAPRCARIQLQDGDMLVMVTDGILDALEGEDKEGDFCRYLAASTQNNATELAQEILSRASASAWSVRDDMTVLVAGVWKK